MCGIVGLINPLNIPLEKLAGINDQLGLGDLCNGMLSLIKHRGPDEFGALFEGQSFLGNARLSIRDLVSGTQPISNQNQDTWVVYNGEIYDDEYLRTDLQKKGHHFLTQSDTEVLVHLYDEYQENMVSHLNGEFAFCLYDRAKKKYFLIRDPFGTKPLYYKKLNSSALLFSSEIKPLLWASSEKPKISSLAVAQTLEAWACIPPHSSFENINQLAPGSILVVDSTGRISEQTYFSWNPVPSQGAVRSEELLRRSVKRRLKSDVPVGVYLSGGLDSSIIAYHVKESGLNDFSTFSVEFDSAQFDESRSQLEMQRMLGSHHHSIKVSGEDIVGNFVDATVYGESVVFRSAFVPMYLLSKLVKDVGYKVILSGEGSDELFGGYDLFREAKILSEWSQGNLNLESAQAGLSKLYSYLPDFKKENLRFIMGFYKSLLDKMDGPYSSHTSRWSNYKNLKSFLLKDHGESPATVAINGLPFQNGSQSVLNRARYVEIITLLHGYLLSTQGDRMASAHSVEVRLPFLDKDMLNFALGSGVENFLDLERGKKNLYQAYTGRLPDSITTKPKQPYLAPDSEIFFNRAAPQDWRDFLSQDSLSGLELFNYSEVAMLLGHLENLCERNLNIPRKLNTAFFSILSSSILFHENKNLSRSSIPEISIKKIVRL